MGFLEILPPIFTVIGILLLSASATMSMVLQKRHGTPR
jgi:hypothetical protein